MSLTLVPRKMMLYAQKCTEEESHLCEKLLFQHLTRQSCRKASTEGPLRGHTNWPGVPQPWPLLCAEKTHHILIERWRSPKRLQSSTSGQQHPGRSTASKWHGLFAQTPSPAYEIASFTSSSNQITGRKLSYKDKKHYSFLSQKESAHFTTHCYN